MELESQGGCGRGNQGTTSEELVETAADNGFRDHVEMNHRHDANEGDSKYEEVAEKKHLLPSGRQRHGDAVAIV